MQGAIDIVVSGGGLAALAGLVAILSALVTRTSIGYAHRRQLIDHPGYRRSHRAPTPRGGGVGPVVAVVVALAGAMYLPCCTTLQLRGTTAALILAVVLVAVVGWLDDHRGLAARWRLAAHLVAAITVVLSSIGASAVYQASSGLAPGLPHIPLYLALCAMCVGVVWSINLHNFMDGIDGILACQALFVFCVLAALLYLRGAPWPIVATIGVFAAATSGFLPFNFPRARIFMGDVGSGALGLLVAFAVIGQMAMPGDTALASGFLLCSAFVTDATCTLVSRLARGRRWYSAHREHLYQWLVRCGFSHVRVVAFYMGWNLLIVLPVVYWMNRSPETHAPQGLAPVVVVYALALAVWCAGKHWCLQRTRTRGLHAAA